MSLRVQPAYTVPDETARVARAAFPKGSLAMHIFDGLGCCYTDEQFAALFPQRGRPAESPGRLAFILVLQFAENLTDRQAADAVRGRIDWKYALGLELTDPGFDFSVLSTFRDRLVAGDATSCLLDGVLTLAQDRGWIKVRGRQRTDSTHILAAIRSLNRVELLGRTLQHALNAVAATEPTWLRPIIPTEWFERYYRLIDEYRLPKAEAERRRVAEQIGLDGQMFLGLLLRDDAPSSVRDLDSVVLLRQVWEQQFDATEASTLRWRNIDELPASAERIASPHDDEARYSTKRSVTWVGYKAHLTETCELETPNLILHVLTTPATEDDSTAIPPIHEALEAAARLPGEHLMDTGYTSGELLTTSRERYGVTIVGPVPPDNSWQARDPEAFATNAFTIDWEAKQVICPQGKVSAHWSAQTGPRGKPVIEVHFRPRDCRKCPVRARCTKSAQSPRGLTLHSQAIHTTLQAARARQTTPEFKTSYAARAGVEGTISQTAAHLGMRRSRYIGRDHTHFQHVATAAAVNLKRLVAWEHGNPRAPTRRTPLVALAKM